jgi:hypothetical protein
MVASSKRRRAIESGFGAKSSGEWTSPSASGVERDHVPIEQQPADARERLLCPAAVGHVLEEPQHAAEAVRPRVVEIVDPPPEQLRGAVEPSRR